jgi:hypothetical protein
MTNHISTKTNKRTNNIYQVKGQFHRRAEVLRRRHYHIDEALTFPATTQQSQIFIDKAPLAFIATTESV